jgi:hypothetical protein
MEDKKYDDTNKGALWINDRKQEDWQASFTGTVNIEGKQFFANLMEVESENPSAPKFRLTFKAKGDVAPKAPSSELEDEIPF